MTTENEQLNNPLHGLKLDILLNEVVEYYGFSILAEYTRINCFKKNPSIASSLKFLRKTEWAREKLERFYLYSFKNLPQPGDDQFEIPPRQRIIPAHHKVGDPEVLIAGEAPPPIIKRNDSSNKSFKSKPSSPRQPKDTADKPWDPWGTLNKD